MNPSHTADVVAQAAGHLNAAAELADERGWDDLFSPWAPFAGQIRLIAAGLTPNPDVIVADHGAPDGISTHLSAAATVLDTVMGAEGPTDLSFWAGHVTDLSHQLKQLAGSA